MPARLIEHLRACSPDFAAEDTDTQRRLALMLWKALEPRRQHSHFPEMVTFTRADIRRMWGSDARMRKTLAGKHFRVLEHSVLEGYTLAYQPSDEMLEAFQQCLARGEPSDLVDDLGRTVTEFPAPISPYRAYTSTRATAWRGICPASAVPIDEKTLLNFLPLAKPREQQIIEPFVLLARNRLRPGCMPVRYVQYSTGRLFAEPLSLQFASKNVRRAALPGAWDYDISACHYAIAVGLADRYGVRAPAIREYVHNKAAVRECIAGETGLTLKQTKRALQMIMYGAPLSDHVKASMPARLGRLAVWRLQENKLFREIHDDVKAVRRPIIDAHTQRAGWVINPMGLRVSAGGKSAAVLAHIIQGYEAMALRAIVQTYGERILLCLHDGWVSAERLELEESEHAIHNAIGIPLRIEEERFADVGVIPRPCTDPLGEGGEFPEQIQELGDEGADVVVTKTRLRGYPVQDLHRGQNLRAVSARCVWNLPPVGG